MDAVELHTKMGIGLDNLPNDIRRSKLLSADNLMKLAGVAVLPVLDAFYTDDKLKNIIQYYSIDPAEMEKELHYYAQQLLNEDKIYEAWQVLLT